MESHCFDSRAIDIRLKDTQELTPRKKTSKFFDTQPQLTPSKNTPAKKFPDFLTNIRKYTRFFYTWVYLTPTFLTPWHI